MAINFTPGSPFSNELANRLVTSGSSLLDSAANKVTDIASSTYDTITSTDFLVSAGVGLLGSALGSKVSRPSLNFPKLAATTQVALSVGQALKAGAATVNEIANAQKGLVTTKTLQPVNIQLTQPASDVDIEIRKKEEPTKFITYPSNLDTLYSLGFSFYEYRRSKFYQDVKAIEAKHIIRLPLPSNLVDALTINYNNFDMGPLRGEALQGLTRTFGESYDELKAFEGLGKLTNTTINNIISEISNNEEIARVVGRKIIQKLSPDIATAMDLAIGNIPNPHTTVTFNGVGLRAFRFTWRFSPNNAKDSTELERLILALKSKSLPRRQTEYVLTYPDFVKVKIYPQKLNDLFKFRPMVVDSFAVNYASAGSLAFLADDMPQEIEVTITLRETEIQTADVYADLAQSKNAIPISG